MPVYLPEWHVGNTGGYYFYPIVFPLLFTHAGNGLAGGGEGLVGGFAEVANSGVFKGVKTSNGVQWQLQINGLQS